MKNLKIVLSIGILFSSALLFVTCGPTQPKETISITAPAAGQKFLAGDTIAVTWSQSVTNPKLTYNYNKGTGGWQAFTTVIAVSANEVKAVLPTLWYSDSFQIKVEDNSGTYEPGLSGRFITRYIIITSPVAGQALNQGQTVPVTFRTLSSKLSSIQFLLSDNGGMSFLDVLTGSVSVSVDSIDWDIGSEPGNIFTYPSNNCIIKISDYTDKKIFDVTGIFSVQ